MKDIILLYINILEVIIRYISISFSYESIDITRSLVHIQYHTFVYAYFMICYSHTPNLKGP